MPASCHGICSRYENKVPMNWRGDGKKYCRLCEYNIITNNLKCECCSRIYRINRNKRSKPTGGKTGRPKAIPIPITTNKLFDW